MCISGWLKRTVMFSAIFLSACGGDEGGSSVPPNTDPSPIGKLLVTDGFGTVNPDTFSRVDFSQYVRGPGANLIGVVGHKPECMVSGLQGMTANVSVQGATLCHYTYTVRNTDSEAVGRLNLLATRSSTPELDPISHPISLGDGPVTFDLSTLHGSNWPNGYAIVPTSVIVQGGSEQGAAQALDLTNILYTPPSEAGWNQVLYVLHNPDKPDNDIFGSIFITISERANQAPTIGEPKYDYQQQTGGVLNTHEQYAFDLDTLLNLDIVEPNGHQWQLIEVRSFSASVVPVNPDSVNNKSFYFTAATSGLHIVSYIIANHYGNFAAGLLRVRVIPKELPKSWDDIAIFPLTYRSPPLYSEASHTLGPDFIVGTHWDTNVNGGAGNNVAAMGITAAGFYCAKQSLPTLSEMINLKLAGLIESWPKEKPYVTHELDDSYGAYDLNTGLHSPGVVGEQYYVTCIEHQESKLSFVLSDVTNGKLKGDGKYYPVGFIETNHSVGVASETEHGISDLKFTLDKSEGGYELQASASGAGKSVFRITSVDTGEFITTDIVNWLSVPGVLETPKNDMQNFANAVSYCAGIGGRLPTGSELQDMFLLSTSSSSLGGPGNNDMCAVHAWPLENCLGGMMSFYWGQGVSSSELVNMSTGEFISISNGTLIGNVACVP